MTGWVKLHRQLLGWEWFHDSQMVHLLIFLLIKANHEDNTWRGKVVKKGQLITGLHALNRETGIPIQTLRTCLNRLENSREINKQSTNKFTIITLCKYDDYNGEQQSEIQNPTNGQQTTNKPSTTNKNVKNIKNDKNKEERKKKGGGTPPPPPPSFLPPSVDDVIAYFREKGYRDEIAVKAHSYYSASDWKDSRGNQVKNWKQKMISVWFKPEHKSDDQTPTSVVIKAGKTKAQFPWKSKPVEFLKDSGLVIFENEMSWSSTVEEQIKFKRGEIDLSYWDLTEQN